MASAYDCGGFEYQFVSTPQDIFVCKICHLPSRDPHLTKCCGHVFCKSCLDAMKEAQSIVNNICPVCRNEDFVTFPNKQVERDIKSLHVYCINKGKGCKWQGEVNCIENHLTKDGGCKYGEVICTSGCGGKMLRRNLTKHVETKCPRRKVNCQYCHLRKEYQFIEGKHKKECAEYPLACPNKCEEAGCIRRKDMNKHRSRCPLEVISCEYETMGCEVRMTRQTQKEHNKEKMEYHLHLTKCKLVETSNELSKNKVELTETKVKLKDQLDAADCKLERTISELNKTSLRLAVALDDLSVTRQQLSSIKVQFSDRFTKLESLLPKTNKNASITAVPTFLPVHEWSSEVHKAAQASSTGNEVTPVIFKMSGIAKKMKTKRDWFSDPFFTHKIGYRMRLQVDIAGCDEFKDTHCSLYVRLMRGRHDDDLSWPVKCSLKVSLLNQIHSSQHHTDTIDFREAMYDRYVSYRVTGGEMADKSWGNPDFIAHEDLSKVTSTCQYLKNDCIFFQVHRM